MYFSDLLIFLFSKQQPLGAILWFLCKMKFVILLLYLRIKRVYNRVSILLYILLYQYVFINSAMQLTQALLHYS